MSRSVNKVEYILFTIMLIFHLDGMTFYCYATFFLQIHIVKHLTACHLDCLRIFQQSVGQCRLAMVYMCDYTEISYVIHLFNSYILKRKDNIKF